MRTRVRTATRALALGRCLTAVVVAMLLHSPARALAQETVVHYHTDAVGSVRMITDEGGGVVARYDYLPFGEPWSPAPPAMNTRQFAGKEQDSETGLDYFGGRYYASGNGRFTTADPVYGLQDNLLDPQRWNRYVYARNNPLRYTDPDGRLPIETIWDLGNVLYDIYAGVTSGDWSDLRGDVLAAAIPYVPAGASKLRHLNKLDDAVDFLRAGDKAGDAARVTGKGDDATEATGIVYRRTDPKTGVAYVGRSKSEDTFLSRQRAHDRNLGTKHEYEVTDRAAPGAHLRAAEESAIRSRGGPGRLANKRYEMNDAAYKACGGTCEKPEP